MLPRGGDSGPAPLAPGLGGKYPFTFHTDIDCSSVDIHCSFILFFFNLILFLNLHNCISFAKYQNESTTGIHVVLKLYYFYKFLLFQVLKLLMDAILLNNFLLLLRQ